MKIYAKYLSYVLRHKWFVMLACFRGRLYWRGLTHDLSKLRPSEFFPYARHFYGDKGDISKGRDETGAYDPTATGNAEFEGAWLLHMQRNDHHWQHWVETRGREYIKEISDIPEMPPGAYVEMICDWVGAGRAQGKPDTLGWYAANGPKMILGKQTRKAVSSIIVIGTFDNLI